MAMDLYPRTRGCTLCECSRNLEVKLEVASRFCDWSKILEGSTLLPDLVYAF